MNKAGANLRVIGHVCIQDELSRQARDLEMLGFATPENLVSAIAQVRDWSLVGGLEFGQVFAAASSSEFH